MKLTTITRKGVDFDVDVSEDGKFSATLKDDVYDADDLDHLRRILDDAVVASRLSVPFVSEYGRRGVMRGYHAGNRDVLVTWDDDGSKSSISQHNKVFSENFDPDLIDELQSLGRVIDQAQDRIQEIMSGAVKASTLFSEAFGEDLSDWYRGKR
jgi:hypothetical protein